MSFYLGRPFAAIPCEVIRIAVTNRGTACREISEDRSTISDVSTAHLARRWPHCNGGFIGSRKKRRLPLQRQGQPSLNSSLQAIAVATPNEFEMYQMTQPSKVIQNVYPTSSCGNVARNPRSSVLSHQDERLTMTRPSGPNQKPKPLRVTHLMTPSTVWSMKHRSTPKSPRHEVLIMAFMKPMFNADLSRMFIVWHASQEQVLMSSLSRPAASEKGSQSGRHPSQTKPHSRTPSATARSVHRTSQRKLVPRGARTWRLRGKQSPDSIDHAKVSGRVADVRWKGDPRDPSECDVSENDSTAITCCGLSPIRVDHFRRYARTAPDTEIGCHGSSTDTVPPTDCTALCNGPLVRVTVSNRSISSSPDISGKTFKNQVAVRSHSNRELEGAEKM